MNYLKARERTDTHRWDYTTSNDGHSYPMGYCAGWREYTPEERERYCMGDAWYKEYEANKGKYHEDGHASAEEAQACYKAYELDTSLRVTQESSAQRQCEVCKAWTQTRVTVGGYSNFVLCDAHATRAEVEKVYTVGESWES